MDHPSLRPASTRSSVTRRTVSRGTLWAAPAVLLAVPAPAMAVSQPASSCVPDPAFSDATVSFRNPTDPEERTAFAVIVDTQSFLTPDMAESEPFTVDITWTQSQACGSGASPDTGITGLSARARSTTGGTAPSVVTSFTPGTSRATAGIDVFNSDDVNQFGTTAAGQVTLEFAWPNRYTREQDCRGVMDVTVDVSYISSCGPITETFTTSVPYGYWASVA